MAGKFRKNIFEELEKVKDLIRREDPDFDMKQLTKFLGRLGSYHYKKKGLYLGKNRNIYKTLLKNGYNPSTVYKWSLLENIPEELKLQLKQGIIGQKKAKKFALQQRRCNSSTLDVRIKQYGLMLIRGM